MCLRRQNEDLQIPDFRLTREFVLQIPLNAQILDAKITGQNIYLYILANDNEKKSERRFLPAVVGQPLNEQLNLKYIAFLSKVNWHQPCLIFEII